MNRWRLVTVGFAVAMIAASAGPAGAALVNSLLDHQGDVVLQANNGLTLNDTTDQELREQPFVDDNTIAADGYYVSSNGTAAVTVARNDDQWTNLTNLDVDQSRVRVHNGSTTHFSVAGATDNVSVRPLDFSQTANGETDIRYAGSSGTTTITIYNQSASLGIKVIDLTTGTKVASGKPGSDGKFTFTVSNSEHKLDLRQGTSNPFVEAAQPIAGAYDKDRTVTLNATVKDPEGANIEVEFFVRESGESSFTKIATTTVSSGSSATTQYTADGGVTRWKVRMNTTDDSDKATSSVFRFRTPGFVSVYNASVKEPTNSLDLLKQNTTLVVQSEDSNYRNVTNQTDAVFDLAGVPDERLRLTLASDGWANRTLVITEPARNYTTHLVPHPDSSLPFKNRTFVQRYELNDKTGSFPADTTRLVVQDYFNGEWRTVAIRAFGGENLAPPVVQHGEVYRLRVVNKNDIRGLGTQEADEQYEPNILTLTVEGVTSDFSADKKGYGWNASYRNPENEDPFLFFDFGTNNTTVARNFELTVYEKGNASNVLFQNNYGVINQLSGTLALTDAQAEKRWVIKWSAEINGEQKSGQRTVGPSRASITVELDPFWKQTFSIGLLFIMAGFFGGVRAELGAIVVPAVAGLFWYLGWLPGWLGGGAIVLGIAVGVMFRSRSATGGVPS